MKKLNFIDFALLRLIFICGSIMISTSLVRAQGGGNGTSASPYLISTTQHLRDLKTYVESGNQQYVGDNIFWKLTADITWNNGSGTANRIGYQDRPFRGHFDGDGHTITMGYISGGSTTDYVGFFGQTFNAEIKNLFLNGTFITARTYSGFLIGEAKGTTTLENVHVTMSMTTSSDIYGAYFGGLIGHTWDIEGKTINITACSASGLVHLIYTSGDADAGGLVGAMRKHTSTGAYFYITDCLADVKFEATGGSKSGHSVGGLIGWTEKNNKVYLTRVVCTTTTPWGGDNKNGAFIGINGSGSVVSYNTLTSLSVHTVGMNDGTFSGNDWTTIGSNWGNGSTEVYNRVERKNNTGGTLASSSKGNERWGYYADNKPKVSKTGYAVKVNKGTGIRSNVQGYRATLGTSYWINADETLTIEPSPAPTNYQKVQYTFEPDYNHSTGAANNYTATMSGYNWLLTPHVNGTVSASIINVPYPMQASASFDQWDRRTTIIWNYNNPQNIAGRFFIYRREVGTSEWTALNQSSGITAENGTNRTATYKNETVPLNEDFEYCIAFVETTGNGPNNPNEISQYQRTSLIVNTNFTLGTWTATATGEETRIVVSFTADTRLDGANYTYAIHRSDNGSEYPTDPRWSGVMSGESSYTFYDEVGGNPCNSYQYRVTITAYTDNIFIKTTAEARTTTLLKFAATNPFKASKGEFANYVRLEWNMDKPAGGASETYRIFRRVANQYENPNEGWLQLETVTTSDATIYWNDVNALTGVYYEYKVTAYQICSGIETELGSRTDIGFTQAFGTVLGRVSYGTGTAVENVNILAVPSDPNEDMNKSYSLRSKGALSKYFEWMSTPEYFNQIWSSNQWTLQFWINPDGTNTATGYNSSTTRIGYIGNHRLHLSAVENGYQIYYALPGVIFASEPIPANHFTHVTIVRDGINSVSIYTVHDSDQNNIEIKQKSTSNGSVEPNLSAADCRIRLGESLWGHIDEIRFWNRPLSEDEIERDYNRRLAGNENGLRGYWNLDDGLEGYTFDMSRIGTVFNGNHATTNTLLFDGKLPDETYQLSFKGITNESGNYQITGIPFVGEGTLYSIVPSMGIHQFNPTEQFRYISPTSMVHNSTDFEDISSFPVSGKVIYEGGTYPVVGCSFEIDYRPVLHPNGELVTTDYDGEFTISVPIGVHTVRVVKQGHTFANDGFLVGQNGENLNYIASLDNIVFHDQTRVKLIGRVVGGLTEDSKPLAFGETINNIGVQTVLLESTRQNYNFTDASFEETFSHNEGEWTKPGGLSNDYTTVDYNPKDVTLHVSPQTGEFVVWIYPEPYNIRNITVPRAGGIPYTVYSNNEMLDLSATPVPDDSFMQFSVRTWKDSLWVEPYENMEGHWQLVDRTDTVKYHAKWQYYYNATPTFSVTQMVDSVPVAYFGEKTFVIESEYSTETEEVELYNDTTGEYFFDIPVFHQGEVYTFLLSAYEEYTNWAIDPDEPVTIHYPVKDGKVNMNNSIDLESDAKTLLMDAKGEFLYQFMAGVPNLTTGMNSFYATLTIGAVSYYWDMGAQQPVEAWHLGNKSTGTDYLTEGPDEIAFILRDPPGSNSMAYLEKGTTHMTKKSFQISNSLEISEMLTFHFGTKTTTFVGIGSGTVFEFDQENNIESGFTLSGKHSFKKEKSTLLTLTERIETSPELDYVGSMGDIFVGYSTNLLFGLTNGISIMNSNEVGDNTETFTSQGNYVIGSTVSMAYGQTFKTRFVYTARDLEKIMIPKWQEGLEELLLPMGTQVNPALLQIPVYVSNLPHSHENFGKLNTDPVFGENASPSNNFSDGPSYTTYFPPEDVYDIKTYATDSVMYFNNQINSWIEQLRLNEQEKVEMQYTNNYSFGGGVSVQYSQKNDTVTNKSNTINVMLNTQIWSNETGFTFNNFGMTWEQTINHEISGEWGWSEKDITSVDTGFTLECSGKFSELTVDYGVSPSGTFSFRTRGGRTQCPYEGEELTKYYQPGQHVLNEGTMRVEVPKIRIASAPYLINVPANREALFSIALENESETDDDIWYQLIVDEATNPDGAILKIDGGPIGNGRLFFVRAGETLLKTLTVEKGTADIYEDITLILRSQCQPDDDFYEGAFDLAKFSVEFIPAVSNVAINEPRPNWILNADNPTGDTLMVAIADYDINFPNFGYIRLQYRSVASPDWNTIMTFYPSHLYENAQGIKEDIGTRPVIYYPWKMIDPDGEYEIRAMITSVNAVDGIIIGDPLSFYYTDAIEGWKDVNPPRPLGLPSPTNGILDIGDEISITYNKDIQTGMLTKNNFSISGVLNAQEIAEPNVGLEFTGGIQSAHTELPIFTSGSFAIETWFKTDLNENGTALRTEGTLFAFGAQENFISLGFNTNGNAILKIANETYTSSTAIAKDETWKYIALCYDRENNTVSVYQFEGATDNYLFVEQPLYTAPATQGRLFVGNNQSMNSGFSGAVSQLHFYGVERFFTDVTSEKSTAKRGNEYGLIGYWIMDEGEGDIARDRARMRHLMLDTDWYIYPSGYAMQTSGSNYFSVPTATYPLNDFRDITIEFWFRSETNQIVADKTLFCVEKVYAAIDETGGITLYTIDGTPLQSLTSQNLMDTQWHHVAVSVRKGVDNVRLSIYIDGENTASFTEEMAGTFSSRNFYFGARYNNNSFDQFFDGYFDEIRIWNSALTLDNIMLHKNSKLCGAEPGLMAYYPFETYTKLSNGLIVVTSTNKNMTDDNTTAGTAIISDIAVAVKDVRPIEDVPFEFTASDRKIVLTIDPDYFARVEGCILNITAKEVLDMRNNESNTELWTAFVNRSPLRWETDPVYITMEAGEAVSFTATITNTGGTNISYVIENLPLWLRVSNSTGNLSPQASRDLQFTVFQGINVGNYETAIRITSANDVVEILPVNVKVTGKRPNWYVNPNDYENSMSLIGLLRIEDIFSNDEDDMVAAFIDGICVGVASPRHNPLNDSWQAMLNVYYSTEDKAIEFRIWEASSGQIYAPVRPLEVTFKANTLIGTPSDPILFETTGQLLNIIPLSTGWNWISLNVNSPSLQNANTIMQGISNAVEIKSQQTFSRYENGVWTNGTLNDQGFNNREMYMVRMDGNNAISMSGEKIDPQTTQISLVQGWNWIAFTPQSNMRTIEALAGLNATPGDIIKGQFTFAVYDATYGWVGSLDFMQPDVGYMYKAAQARTFFYPNVMASQAKSAINTGQNNKNNEIAPKYESNLSIIGEVILTDAEVSEAAILIAKINGQERGRSQIYTLHEKQLFFLPVFADSKDETITFTLLDNNTETPLSQLITFKSNATIGTIDEPLLLTNDNVNLTIYPNPTTGKFIVSGFRFQASEKSNVAYNDNDNGACPIVEIYDIAGRLVHHEPCPTNHIPCPVKIDISHLENGVYFVKINNETIKLVKQ